MTSIKFNRPLQDCTATMYSAAGQTDSDVDVSEILLMVTEPRRFETFEGDGFSLVDAGRLARPTDAVGACTASATGETNDNWVKIVFGTPVYIENGIRLTFYQEEAPQTPTQSTTYLTAKLYAERDSSSEFKQMVEQVTYNRTDRTIEFVDLRDTGYPYVGEITIKGLLTYDNQHFRHLINISEITDFQNESVKVIGQPELHTQMSPTLDDLPMTTGSFVVETTGDTPRNGDEVVVETDLFRQGLLVDSVTRQAANIFSVSCNDELTVADKWSVNDQAAKRVTGNLKHGCPIVIEPDTDIDSGANWSALGFYTNATSCRQAYAIYQAAVGKFLTSWNARGLRWVDRLNALAAGRTPTVVRAFASGDILGRAEYQSIQRYSKVINKNSFSYTAAGTTEQIEYDLMKYTANSKGALNTYDYSKCTMCIKAVEGGSATDWTVPTKTLERLAKYINADEVTFQAVYGGEDLGDWVTVQTPYDGTFKGYITEMSLTLSVNVAVATYKVRGELQ